MIEGDHLRSQIMFVFCWFIKISLWCKQIYVPWIVSSGKKSNTTTIGSGRQRIWSNNIFLFQTFVSQTFEQSIQRFSSVWQVCWYFISCSRDNFLCLDSVFRKKVNYQYNQLRHIKNLVKSHFSFTNFCHRNFWAIASVIFNFVRNCEFWNSWKSTQGVGMIVGTI